MTRIATGRLVRVTKEAPHHVGVCGIIDFYGTGPSEGVVVLWIGHHTRIAVDENHIELLQSED